MTTEAAPKQSMAAGIKAAVRRNAEIAAANRPPAPPVAAPVRPPALRRRRVRPPAPVDALALLWPDRAERLISVGHAGRDLSDLTDAPALETYAAGTMPRDAAIRHLARPARPAPRGPAAMLAHLERRGIRVIATGDGNCAVLAEAGRLDIATRDAISAALPLLRAHLHGTPLRCALPNHVGEEPPEAVTLALGGAPACAECIGGKAAPEVEPEPAASPSPYWRTPQWHREAGEGQA